jgi:TonB family protein
MLEKLYTCLNGFMRNGFYWLFIVMIVLSGCTSTITSPAVVSPGQNISQASKFRNPPPSKEMFEYHLNVVKKVKEVWRLPEKALSGENLLTIVVAKVRKDGKIVNIEMEKSSGNKAYDESTMLALRAAEPLPIMPAVLNTDFLELGFNFMPEK